jgi:uncharacterized protein
MINHKGGHMIQIAIVQTEKAERLMKALCNHFSRKTTARYEGDKGYVDFGDGKCELTAGSSTLTLQVEAQNAEALTRLTQVVADHLERFTPGEELAIRWGEVQENSR